MSEISRLALAKERSAILEARAQGAAALPELQVLARHDDAEVREIALYGLDEIGDRRGSPIFAEALLDPGPMVRGVAMRALLKRPDPAVYDLLLDAYDKSPEPVVRHTVALILGRIGAPTAKPADILRRFEAESDPFAEEGCLVALAKLGDERAQERFAELLAASRGRTRGRFLEHAAYLHAPWVIRALGPVLADRTPLLRIGDDGVPGPEYLRACDLAVNLVAEISGWHFSFPVARAVNYSDADLAEVARFVDATPNPVNTP